MTSPDDIVHTRGTSEGAQRQGRRKDRGRLVDRRARGLQWHDEVERLNGGARAPGACAGDLQLRRPKADPSSVPNSDVISTDSRNWVQRGEAAHAPSLGRSCLVDRDEHARIRRHDLSEATRRVASLELRVPKCRWAILDMQLSERPGRLQPQVRSVRSPRSARYPLRLAYCIFPRSLS